MTRRPEARLAANAPGDVHLRSALEVGGYSVLGTDAAMGHIADFIVDDESWAIRYLVADVGHWWSGKLVLVAPHWARRIDWDKRKVFVDMDRRAVQGGPPAWNPEAPSIASTRRVCSITMADPSI